MTAGRSRGLTSFTLAIAGVAFIAPVIWPEPAKVDGLLLIAAAAVQTLHGFRRRRPEAQRVAWVGAALTGALALLLLNSPWLAGAAIAVFVAVPFLVDAARHAGSAWRASRTGTAAGPELLAFVRNLAVGVGLFVVGDWAVAWTVAAASGLRILGTAHDMRSEPVFTAEAADDSVVADVGIDSPQLSALAARIEAEESARVGVDRGWVLTIIAVLFAIHVGRMGFDRSALGVLSPAIAVLGDIVVALALAYVVIIPIRLGLRRATRRSERRVLPFALDDTPLPLARALLRRLARVATESRLRLAIRLRAARYDIRLAIWRGLQTGLPLAAVFVATVPVWGMSWYFDTENWAAGIWNSWAAARTDTWRAAMVDAVTAGGLSTLDGRGFDLEPPGVTAGTPFSFVVIGDTGEGDASQHVLRDQLLLAAAADDVRFVVISSDVVYPTGAMKDYESRFWLPFKGVTKPVYAIPGNHDWYDALEAFVATFFTPEAARLAMRARIEADEHLSSTTDRTIEADIDRADQLRREYDVPTGFQTAPFFQVRTDDFVLIAVDTGVLKQIDAEQLAWLQATLDASRGRFVMALLGHPFFAGGVDQTVGYEEFAALRTLLRQYDVPLVMAGDTHDLEYYVEPGSGRDVTHVVNGGGGAYLSFGTALAWPATPVTSEWAYYPGYRDVVGKIRRYTPLWKWPAWFWTEQFGAWPYSPEWLSALFDYNVAPFFQSFVVVRVDPAARLVELRPWGVHGPLKWSDFDQAPGVRPPAASPNDAVVWTLPMDR